MLAGAAVKVAGAGECSETAALRAAGEPGSDRGRGWVARALRAAGPAGDAGSAGVGGPVVVAGPAGDAGSAGVGGPVAVAGPAGDAGSAGVGGPVVVAGPAGDAGSAGVGGPVAVAGPAGDAGSAGVRGPVAVAGPAGDAGRSRRMAMACTSAPTAMIAVISSTPLAGELTMIRRTRGCAPRASIGPSWLIRRLACCVVQGASCSADLAPASVSASTWANRLGQAPAPGTGSAEPGSAAAGLRAADLRAGSVTASPRAAGWGVPGPVAGWGVPGPVAGWGVPGPVAGWGVPGPAAGSEPIRVRRRGRRERAVAAGASSYGGASSGNSTFAMARASGSGLCPRVARLTRVRRGAPGMSGTGPGSSCSNAGGGVSWSGNSGESGMVDLYLEPPTVSRRPARGAGQAGPGRRRRQECAAPLTGSR